MRDDIIERTPGANVALARVARRQQGPRRHLMPVGLIGPRDATDAQLHIAETIAHALAAAGIAIVGGGKGGVMEAAARGARGANGLVIGLLPEDDAAGANPHLSVALPTGLGITRNALIARASLCLIAVGGGLGTLSEIALGLQWGKPVFTICDAPQVTGVENFGAPEPLLARVAQWLVDSV
ncbi:LOG family protein [Burkholderia savannae]|uniref:Lysine decarboxylase n=2 Tax=Burkholderia TaxID=32008 RepID=A0ABR5T6Z7_9BURK|nr:lysine decarboxylase [Burkholderia savannae]KGR96403.1 DNA recombination-mediator A family protein [Burkholderia sp. ABCPW 111]KVG46328.1 lysine decarboxylase [Burkholderia sp. MSMB0265]KVG89527.1 lysine decarboxylase [Burkholderia sp. MSMB2040]KVG95774.1 lysine decarboxylase [Burkholderia sp. MSMB2041]KVH00760.1 lysine decarboxylase [Burkholderia sp. MSMB2042]KVK72694.1 lysine decarboxylase [Burkholderia sp. MSMB1498]